MRGDASKSLLPDGLRDVLPPDAAHEAATVGGLIARFEAEGYQRVEPPLVEFEDSLLDGPGAAVAPSTFRLMDPVSQRMMGVRADMTVQVARIATSRLARQARPVRLCYAGPTLRVRGQQLRPERQVTQAGCELIGSDAAEADAEAIALAANALAAVGLKRLSVDIALPTLAPALFETLGLDAETRAAARSALDRRDAAAVRDLGGEAARVLGALLDASGRAGPALEGLQALGLPSSTAGEIDRLSAVLPRLAEAAPDLSVTVDAVEHRGFEYQTGLSFTLFAKGVRGELGRGGRYAAGAGPDKAGEAATGFSLYLDSVMRGAPAPKPAARCFLPTASALEVGPRLRAAGWITVAGLDAGSDEDPARQARRLGCTHYLDPEDGPGGEPRALG
ncbi:MAG: ATP phosphoribosyltransferase regulatory subunit [Marivibrio sp.]|uniref:ATP phosphoribosyltransferase regulatory subunit n=1 Tax=Marivibrio sp. TaxID=2039719 RepID=UPI0032EE2619